MCLVVLVLAVLAGSARAAVTDFPVPTANAQPGGIVTGPDGALWFTEGAADKVGRITTSGQFTEYPLPTANAYPGTIAVGSDGALWFTESVAQIGRISPAGVITEYLLPSGWQPPMGIIAGPDGALWFIEPSSQPYTGFIGRITTTGVVSEFQLPFNVNAQALTTGPDGNVWFTESNGNYVGRITPAGDVSEFPLPPMPASNDARFLPSITTGPDGALWFTIQMSCFPCGIIGWSGAFVDRITTSGQVTQYPVALGPVDDPTQIITGPDGALWFADTNLAWGGIARSTPFGVITETLPMVSANYLTVGPDKAIWFTDNSNNLIGRMTVPPPVNTNPPTISGTAQEGSTLAESHGSWTYSPTFYSYQWLRCDTAGNNCVSISNASSQTYKLVAADIGRTIKVQEWAKSVGGTGGPATSTQTAVVLPLPPANTGRPKVVGTATGGQTLVEFHGTWTNSPTSYGYQWQRCDSSGNNCAPITGAMNQTYTLTGFDIGSTIRAQEWAANPGGIGGPATSPATGVIQAPTPPPTPPGPPQTAPAPPAPPPAHTTLQVTAAQITAQLLKQLAPSGKSAKIASLLKTGKYTYTIKTLTAGRVAIDWYYLAKGANLNKPNRKPKPVLIATGKATFAKSTLVKITIKLTANGKLMLKATKGLKLTAKGTYTPAGKSGVSATRAFTLRR